MLKNYKAAQVGSNAMKPNLRHCLPKPAHPENCTLLCALCVLCEKLVLALPAPRPTL